MSPIDQLAKLQSACPPQLSCVASEVNEQGETEYSHIVQADGVYLSCPAGVYPPFAQFAVWVANNTPAIVAERDALEAEVDRAEDDRLLWIQIGREAQSERDALREQHDAMAKLVGKLKDMLACPASYKSRMNMLEDIRAIVMDGKEFETADGELLVEAYADIDALKQQLAERDAEIERLRAALYGEDCE